MNSFEQIVAKIFENKKYWIKSNIRVNLTREEKIAIMKEPKRSTIPRPEIDLIAYSPSNNELLIIEAKSYFDSNGVMRSELENEYDIPEGVYKLLTCSNYRTIVTSALIMQLREFGLIINEPVVKYVLVAGKVFPENDLNEISAINTILSARNASLMDITQIKNELRNIASNGYEDDVVTMATKIYKDPELLD